MKPCSCIILEVGEGGRGGEGEREREGAGGREGGGERAREDKGEVQINKHKKKQTERGGGERRSRSNRTQINRKKKENRQSKDVDTSNANNTHKGIQPPYNRYKRNTTI